MFNHLSYLASPDGLYPEGRWTNRFRIWISSATLSTAAAKALAGKMKNLQKENDLLRRQRDILKKALGKLSERSRGIVISIYSDRGCQYAGTSFRQMLERKGIISSMSRKGNCYVNAALESFWSTLKAEVVPFLMGLSRR